jgi:hypothetical protein
MPRVIPRLDAARTMGHRPGVAPRAPPRRSTNSHDEIKAENRASGSLAPFDVDDPPTAHAPQTESVDGPRSHPIPSLA